MNQKKAKALRRAVRELKLPESVLMISQKTGQIKQGAGARATYRKVKKGGESIHQTFIAGVAARVPA